MYLQKTCRSYNQLWIDSLLVLCGVDACWSIRMMPCLVTADDETVAAAELRAVFMCCIHAVSYFHVIVTVQYTWLSSSSLSFPLFCSSVVFFFFLGVYLAACSVLGMHLFGGKFCQHRLENRPCSCDEVNNSTMCKCERKNFDSLHWSLVTVFQVKKTTTKQLQCFVFVCFFCLKIGEYVKWICYLIVHFVPQIKLITISFVQIKVNVESFSEIWYKISWDLMTFYLAYYFTFDLGCSDRQCMSCCYTACKQSKWQTKCWWVWA